MATKRKAEHDDLDVCSICILNPIQHTCLCGAANCLNCLIEYFKHDSTLPRCPNCRDHFKYETMESIFKSKFNDVVNCIKDKLYTNAITDKPFLTNVYRQCVRRLIFYSKLLKPAFTMFAINLIRENRNLRNLHYINSPQFMLAMLANNCKNKKQDIAKYIDKLVSLNRDINSVTDFPALATKKHRDVIADEIELAKSVTDEHQRQATALRRNTKNPWHKNVILMPADVDITEVLLWTHHLNVNINTDLQLLIPRLPMVQRSAEYIIDIAFAHHDVGILKRLYLPFKAYCGMFNDDSQVIVSSYNTLLTISSEAKLLQIARPCFMCAGYLNNDYKCFMCNRTFCKRCEDLLNPAHECVQDNVESVLKIKETTKPCPHCWTRIEKKSGCDEMYCVNCKFTFNWVDGVVQMPNHNPIRDIVVGDNRYAAMINELRKTSYVNPGQFTNFSAYSKRLIYNWMSAGAIRDEAFKGFMTSIKNRLMYNLDRATSNELLRKMTQGAPTEELDKVIADYYTKRIEILR